MKNFFLVWFMLAGFSSQSQSIQETSQWILEQYNLYEREINNDRELIIENGILYYKWTVGDNQGF